MLLEQTLGRLPLLKLVAAKLYGQLNLNLLDETTDWAACGFCLCI